MTDQLTGRADGRGNGHRDRDDDTEHEVDAEPVVDATDAADVVAAPEADAEVEPAAATPAGPPAPQATQAPAPAEGTNGRDSHLDNVKFVAITLVVVGHAWGPMLAWSRSLEAAYLFLYTVHMPIFVTLSGYFSRHFTASPRQARSLVRSVVVPYLIIESAFTLYRHFGAGQDLEFALHDPWWITWFLATLFFWRLSSPVWRVVRFPIVIAVVVSLAAGSAELTGALELGRMLQYLPFFVIGLSLRREHFAWLRTLWVRLAAVPILAGAIYGAYVLAPHVSVEWVYWRQGNEALGVSYPIFALVKIAQLAATVLVLLAVISLVPGRRLPVITGFGAASMYAYLLHGFAAKGAEWWDVYDLPFVHTHAGIVVVTLAAVVLTLVLCSPPVRVLFSWAVQPKLEGWLRGPTDRSLS
ncbi:MAG: acyltransferase family protein [Streptosporangiales bacterium]|nr:acyltransferase family protein [Streptosporangiales bacterium]